MRISDLFARTPSFAKTQKAIDKAVSASDVFNTWCKDIAHKPDQKMPAHVRRAQQAMFKFATGNNQQKVLKAIGVRTEVKTLRQVQLVKKHFNLKY